MNVFTSAADAVDSIIAGNVQPTDVCSALPKTASLARAANRFRTKTRPNHPQTLDFEIQLDHMPQDFLRADVSSTNSRHLIFVTDRQLQLLSNAKTWLVACLL